MRRLYKELENYGKSDFYPFHMPGHKRNKACIEGDFPIERDITDVTPEEVETVTILKDAAAVANLRA